MCQKHMRFLKEFSCIKPFCFHGSQILWNRPCFYLLETMMKDKRVGFFNLFNVSPLLHHHWSSQTPLHKEQNTWSICRYKWHIGGTNSLFVWLFNYVLFWNSCGGWRVKRYIYFPIYKSLSSIHQYTSIIRKMKFVFQSDLKYFIFHSRCFTHSNYSYSWQIFWWFYW